jgi:Zn finger protein HypA/HybF involved in hydrogenase expression
VVLHQIANLSPSGSAGSIPVRGVLFKMETEMKEIKCKDCGKKFQAKKNSKYARKYCDKCSKQRKKDYENLYMVTADECEEED